MECEMKGRNLATLALVAGAVFALAGCARPTVQPVQPVASTATYQTQYMTATQRSCFSCAKVVAIEPIPENSSNVALGSIIGAIVGGVVGHQFGSGSGQTITTIGGAVAGAAIGSQVTNGGRYDYRVTVRRNNGAMRTFVVDKAPNYGVGTIVKLNATAI